MPELYGVLGSTHLAAAMRPKRKTSAGAALLRVRIPQASRTISAFTVVIITIAILWYVGATSCTSFFFAYQGFLPMQVRPVRSDCKGAWRQLLSHFADGALMYSLHILLMLQLVFGWRVSHYLSQNVCVPIADAAWGLGLRSVA